MESMTNWLGIAPIVLQSCLTLISLHRYTEGFSRGMKQKTALLRALAHGPQILLLDEPTGGLDVTSARTVRQLVRKLKDEGGTVVYSTHHLAEAQQVCDRIIMSITESYKQMALQGITRTNTDLNT